MQRKILRVRYLIILVLVLLLSISTILYFTSNLKKYTLKNDLTPFSEEGFKDASDPTNVLNNNVMVAENERFQMFFDETTTILTIYDKLTKKTYQTADKKAVDKKLRSPFIVEYIDMDDVSGGINRLDGYDNSVEFNDEVTNKITRHYSFKYLENAVQVYYDVGYHGMTMDYFPIQITEERYNQLILNNPFIKARRDVYDRLKRYYQSSIVDGQKIYKVEAQTDTVKMYLYRAFYELGYQPYDENGEPMWETDENGDYILDENGELIPVNKKYSIEDAALHNAETGLYTNVVLPRFKFAVEFKLVDSGFEYKIIRNSIKEGKEAKSNHKITAITILHNFTQVRDTDTQEGMIVIPDGSGAVINFNNQKIYSEYYSKGIYGTDMSFYPKEKPANNQKIMFPMFGFIDITNSKGVMGVVEEGAALTRIEADIPRTASPYNKVYFKSVLRMNEEVRVGASAAYAKPFTKWSRDIVDIDFKYLFEFLTEDELSYSKLAQKYRQYLIDKYDLIENDYSYRDSVLVNVNVIGAFERYNSFLGFKYKEQASLTTFKQAQEILTELQELGVNNINLLYTAWTQDAIDVKLRNNIKANKVLGGKKELQKLMLYLNNNNIDFYPETYVGTSKGYTQFFGKMRFTARSVSSAYAEHFPYHLSTNQPDKALPATYYISPDYYQDISKRLLNNLSSLNINSVMISDLGNYKVANYSKSHNINLVEGIKYQVESLKQLDNKIDKLLLKAPFDYAFKYTKVAVDVPIKTSSYGIFDYEIPFYQLVAGGLFEYSTPSINGNYQNKQWILLKAIETGSSLLYDLSYEDPKILLDTDYSMYYYTYYQNWTYEISDLVSQINELQIQNGYLIEHQQLTYNVAKVKYSNGVTLIVNSSLNDVYYEGYLVKANTFRVIPSLEEKNNG